MALTVQDDTGLVAGANGYISVSWFKSYHLDRGTMTAAADSAIESAIIRATDYVDQRFHFVGRQSNGRQQTTEWPRFGADDRNGYGIDGLPMELKEAVAEYALRSLTATLNPDVPATETGAAILSKSETVGPISESVTYANPAQVQLPKYPAADMKLRAAGLLRSSGEIRRG